MLLNIEMSRGSKEAYTRAHFLQGLLQLRLTDTFLCRDMSLLSLYTPR